MEPKTIHRTGCARILSPEEAQKKYHGSEGYQAVINIHRPGDSEVVFAEATVIKEGVWSDLYESAAVLANAATSLLGKYIMLGHPDCTTCPSWPDEALGQVIDYRVEGPESSLVTLWVLWVNRLSPELLQRFQSGEKIGVSVGFQQYFKESGGVWNDKPYQAVADKIYFEHIGIVPIGACTVDDGCEAHLVNQNPQGSGEITKDGTQECGTVSKPNVVTQAVIAAPVDSEPERPPPLFKNPDELIAFTNGAMLIKDNPELLVKQVETAFNFVMDNVHEYGWSIFDIKDPIARANAMATFVARGAEAWKSGDPVFSPVVSQIVGVAQSPARRSWMGNKEAQIVTQSKKPDEKDVKIKYSYPSIEEKDGKSSIVWNSTEDEKEAQKSTEAMLKQFTDTAASLKSDVEKGAAADGIARALLMTSLKGSLPNLSDSSLKRYEAMDLSTLAGIVGDLGQAPAGLGDAASAGASADDGGEGDGSGPGVAALQTPKPGHQKQAPTPYSLQRLDRSKKMTGVDAMKRLSKELGVKI